MNGVIVYFPWGAGGNLVRNLITIDTRFEFLDDQDPIGKYPTEDGRYNFLLDYYSKPMDPTTWLPREWSLRARFHARYYEGGNCVYWNPDSLLVYDVHGGGTEIDNILDSRPLKCYDRYRIDRGLRSEQLSNWALVECTHIFLLPSDIPQITKIYNSKNPTINQLENEGDLEYRQKEAEIINTTMTNRLIGLSQKLIDQHQTVYKYDCIDLYKTPDIIYNIADNLSLSIKKEYINTIHSLWLQSTREVYYNYFNKELKL